LHGAERLTYPKHGSVVSLTLSNGNTTIEWNFIEYCSHRLDGGAISQLAVASTSPFSRRYGSHFGSPYEVWSKVANTAHGLAREGGFSILR
jgi:hypothetical protein